MDETNIRFFGYSTIVWIIIIIQKKLKILIQRLKKEKGNSKNKVVNSKLFVFPAMI